MYDFLFLFFFHKKSFFFWPLVYIFSLALAACVIMRYLGGSYANNRAP